MILQILKSIENNSKKLRKKIIDAKTNKVLKDLGVDNL